MELLGHMIAFRENHHRVKCNCKYLTEPSGYLNVEVSDSNIDVLRNTAHLICGDSIESKRNILADSYGTNAKMKLARRKLDSWGNVKSHCCFVNSENNLKKNTRT